MQLFIFHLCQLLCFQTIEWPLKYAEKFQKLKLTYPHGVLLIGPPGCCKTTLVTTAANATNTVFMSLTSAQLYSPYVGHSETLLTEVRPLHVILNFVYGSL